MKAFIHAMSFVVPVLMSIFVSVRQADCGENSVERVDVFVSGQEGYHTYRIPAIVATSQQTLLAFCEGRKTSIEDSGDVDLLVKRSSDGGKTWGPLELVHEEGGTAKVTIGNPCPVVDESTGTIWLPFLRNSDDVLLTHSTDDGRSWATPVEITDAVKKRNWYYYATGPGVGIQLSSSAHRGRLVIPSHHSEQIDDKAVILSHVFYSDDHGQTWQLGDSVGLHTNECQVAELSDGRLIMNMRNYWGRNSEIPERGGMRAVSYSSDGGETWSELEFHKTLVEPVCQASILGYSIDGTEKQRLLFSNPASSTERHRLTVRLSEDEGRSWANAKILHDGPSAYSCLVILPSGSIGCLYEGGTHNPNEKIIFAQFSSNWLTNGTSLSTPRP